MVGTQMDKHKSPPAKSPASPGFLRRWFQDPAPPAVPDPLPAQTPPESGPPELPPAARDQPVLRDLFRSLPQEDPARQPEVVALFDREQQDLTLLLTRAREELQQSTQRLTACLENASPSPDGTRAADDTAAAIGNELVFLSRPANRDLRQAISHRITGPHPGRIAVETIGRHYQQVIQGCPETVPLILPRRSFGESPTAPPPEPADARPKSLRFHLRYRIWHLPLQELLGEHLLERLRPEQEELLQARQGVLDEIRERLDTEWGAIRFNLETAVLELREPRREGEEPLDLEDVVLGTLRRSEQGYAELLDPYRTYLEEFREHLSRDHRLACEGLLLDIRQAGTLKVRLRSGARRIQRFLHGQWGRARNQLKEGSRRLVRRGRRLYFHLEDLTLPLLARMGLVVRMGESLLELTDLPRQEDLAKHVSTLPPIHRRLFSSQPLLTREFLVGRDRELVTVSELLERWKSGRAGNAAVVGPEGSGKTSLLNCMGTEFGLRDECRRVYLSRRLGRRTEAIEMVASWFGLAGPSGSADNLVERLLALPRQILLCEGGHNLMFRSIGGQKAAETFFYLMMATRHHFLWMVTFRLYPWKRMEYLLEPSQYFTHVIRTLLHDEAQLRQAILARARSSGYPLLYSPEGISDRTVRKLLFSHPADSPAVQKALEERYFEELFAISGGNMLAAIFYWLLSLSHDVERETVRVSSRQRIDFRFLQDFNSLYLFTLAELLNHGELTGEEHRTLFRTDSFTSLRVLDYLCRLQLVYRVAPDDSDGVTRYRIYPPVLHGISSMLESMNILY